jgi:hypothetical protein
MDPASLCASVALKGKAKKIRSSALQAKKIIRLLANLDFMSKPPIPVSEQKQ